MGEGNSHEKQFAATTQHTEAIIDHAYEALLWISEFPNRQIGFAKDDAVELAEYARAALDEMEAMLRVR